MRYKFLIFILFNALNIFAQEIKPEVFEIENFGLEIQSLKVMKISAVEGTEKLSPHSSESQRELNSAAETPVSEKPDTSINNKNSINHPITAHPHFIKHRVDVLKNPDDSIVESKVVANDDICSAVTIAVDGTCTTNQTNIGATKDYYGGCVLSTDRTVWYKFTLTGANNTIDITFATPGGLGGTSLGQGGDIYTFLMDGTCTVPGGISTICALPSTHFIWDGLTAGTYYLLVATTNANTGNFNICATQSVSALGNQTGPEQDCLGAKPLCVSPENFEGSYLGNGAVQEVSSTASCLLGQETNSVWYVFSPQSTGTFGFSINTSKDYDFALYDITTIGCAGIPTATPIRCNFSDDLGATGLDIPGSAQAPSLSVDDTGLPTMNGVSDMAAGNTYALIIDNWTGDNNGFEITVTGTASIIDNTAPTMSTIVPSCTANTIMLTMSEAVQCISVQQNDFQLIYDPAGANTDVTSKISTVSGYNCPVTGGALTTQILITTDGTLATGPYQLKINAGPSMADKCDNKIVAASTINFNYLRDNLALVATPTSICSGASVSLDADGADGTPSFITYTLNPGGLTNTTDGVFGGLSPLISTTYNVSVTYGGCTRSASASVTVEGNIVTTISPSSKTLCAATTTPLTASTTINGVNCPTCTYVWSTTETTASITVGAGTYTVAATSPAGCTNSNSPSSTVSLASAGTGGTTCDVIYVSPAGGGNGLSKGAPTTLAAAVTAAMCTNTIIKMQVGIYTITNYQAFDSYMTIEGGYNAGFTTKSSDMSGGANSTTIRRSNAADTDVGTECSAFKLANGADQFRIQDIRIEMPPNASYAGHAASSNKTNYGIKLGTGCTNYIIVRCYIDAGVGAAP